MSGSPVELVGTHGLELVEFGPEDSKVDIMAQIDPHEYEEGKIRANEEVIEVVKGFRGLSMLGRYQSEGLKNTHS